MGRYEHEALTTCSRALGLKKLAEKLNELIALNCMPPFKLSEGTLIECIDNLAGIFDKPPFSDAGLFKNDEGFPELREDFPNGKRPGKRWTGFAHNAWESIDLFLRSKNSVPKMELIPKNDH